MQLLVIPKYSFVKPLINLRTSSAAGWDANPSPLATLSDIQLKSKRTFLTT